MKLEIKTLRAEGGWKLNHFWRIPHTVKDPTCRGFVIRLLTLQIFFILDSEYPWPPYFKSLLTLELPPKRKLAGRLLGLSKKNT